MGCPGNGPYPSYSGIYGLESQTVRSSDEVFPFEYKIPANILVTQNVFSASSDHRSIDKAVELYFNLADSESYLLHGVLGAEGSGQGTSIVRSLFGSHHVSDTTSEFLGFGVGYACAFTYGASISARVIDPSPSILRSAYPECIVEETSRGPLCVGRTRYQDLPVDYGPWGEAGVPRIAIEIEAHKAQTNSSEYCRRPGSFAQIVLIYSRVAAMEGVDLRISAIEAQAIGLTPRLSELTGNTNGIGEIIDLPPRAQDLINVWPIAAE
jgi:hypothetical protein